MTTETERPLHLAPQTWMRETGIRIMDPDGWRKHAPGGEKDFQDPITREEFIERCMISTCSRWPDPPYDERPEPPNEFVSMLAEALKSEFGAQFGMGIQAEDESWKRAARGIARKMRCELYSDTDMHKIVRFRNQEGE